MYIVGHYVTTLLSQRFSTGTLNGNAGAALYLPDFVRCHEWGYANCFSLPDKDPISALIKSHILGDWWVHYGESEINKRRGWAYRRMAAYAHYYNTFYDVAHRESLIINPSGERDSVRGFAHTMMEYAIDTHLSAHLPAKAFSAIKCCIEGIGASSGEWSMPAVQAVLATREITVKLNAIDADISSFRARAVAARTPAELAYRAGVKKFGLHDCDESLRLVSGTVAAGLASLGADEVDAAVSHAAAFIAQHICHQH